MTITAPRRTIASTTAALLGLTLLATGATAAPSPSPTATANPAGSSSAVNDELVPLPAGKGGTTLYVEARGGTTVHVVSGWGFQEGLFSGGSVVWDFGDGTTEVVEGIGWGTTYGNARTNHTYSAPGTYTITGTAVDDKNRFVTDTLTVQVGNRIALSSFAKGASKESAFLNRRRVGRGRPRRTSTPAPTGRRAASCSPGRASPRAATCRGSGSRTWI